MTTKENIINTIQNNKPELFSLGVKTIGLFGSYAKGEQSDNSDIDILVDFDSDKENYDNYMAVYDKLEQLFKNEHVEIVTINGLSPYIGPMILKEVEYV